MRRIIPLAAVVATVAALAATANAGPTTIDANGNFMALDTDITPPTSSTSRTAQGVTLNFQLALGNSRTGDSYPEADSLVFGLQKGFRSNGAALPSCPIPTAETIAKESRCDTKAKIGSGSALADLRRSGVADPVPATLTAYNGAKQGKEPTLMIFATASSGPAAGATVELDFAVKHSSKGLTFTTVDFLPTLPGVPVSYYRFDLKVGKTFKVKQGGRNVKVPLLVAPTTCAGGTWKSSFATNFANGTSNVATDQSPCVRVVEAR